MGKFLSFNASAFVQWSEAGIFFASNESLLKQVRNDVGGHFGSAAALYAVDNFEPLAASSLELLETIPSEWAERLHFVSLIREARKLTKPALFH
jgi:hypothetical protein